MSFMGRVFGAAADVLTGRGGAPNYTRDTDVTFDNLNMTGFSWSTQSVTGIQINQQTAMSCAAVMACVSILAEDISKLTPKIFTPDAKLGRRELASHFLTSLLAKPNSWQTWGDFCGQMMLGLLLRGNGFAVIVRRPNGQPAFLVPVNPDQVTLYESPDGSLFWQVSRTGLFQTAQLASQPFLIPNYDMFHLKGLSANGLLGFSKIALCREAIGLALAQEQQAARWMGQGAKPSGILTTEQKLTEESAKRAKANWNEAQSGLMNSGKTAVLEMGLKWMPLTMSAQDIEFIASRNYQKTEIAAIFRVPPHMIGIIEKGVTQNITQQSQDYFNSTLSTYTQIWKRRLGFTFNLDGEDAECDFDRSILLEGDIGSRFQMYRLGLQGVLSTNECRRMERLGPAPEGDDVAPGDQVFRPSNMAPLDSDVFLGADLDPKPGAADPVPGAVGSDASGSAPEGAGHPPASGPTAEQKV